MLNPSFERREFFHLHFLRHLSQRLAGRNYAVKGGMCLRLFHRSPRLSEDMDLDVTAQVGFKTLQKAVDAILHSGSFAGSFIPQGILRLEVTKPKQTETTQRWKVALFLSENVALPAKIEFSRRQETMRPISGIPHAELLHQHQMVPFAAQFYDAQSMVAQKIQALASPSRQAARDLFDVHHLLFTLAVNKEEIPRSVPAETLRRAAEKVTQFSFQHFKGQVLPFLSESMITLYHDATFFEQMKSDVEQMLLRMAP
ncbi:MAG: nucleotidyl transferase AbiEii/AbiGii toxin family protein [Elusimicrobia bacterium]|nr:nucleotidyl transferase AbiEii/AbiGii toxin family protein [Elusimicrobiota bacterium]